MNELDPSSSIPLPLTGVRVVDVSRFVAGPLSTFFLASMGAEVIAVAVDTPARSATSYTVVMPPHQLSGQGVPRSVVVSGYKCR